MSPETKELLRQAHAFHKMGDLPQAEQAYREFLAANPRHAMAHHNLGVIAAQTGRLEEAIVHFHTAREADSRLEIIWFSLARAQAKAHSRRQALATLNQARLRGVPGTKLAGFMMELAKGCSDLSLFEQAEHLGYALAWRGEFEGALASLKRAFALKPAETGILLEIGRSTSASGRPAEAISWFSKALTIDANCPEAHRHLGSLLSEGGQVAEGFAHYLRRAALAYSLGTASEPPSEAVHKVKHDAEQRAFLAQSGIAAVDAGLPFYLPVTERIKGAAVRWRDDSDGVLEQWQASHPQHAVIDNFLTPEALTLLQDFCLNATIWRKVYDAGYLGATPEDGFSCPLLAQIIEEVNASLPSVFQNNPFRYLGAFKYDSSLSRGTNIHADNSAVNLNLYITPDSANLDPQSGGMDLWDAQMPAGIDMRVYNGDEAAAKAFLVSSGAKMTRIPHRCNRAILFRSDLFHKTSDCRFKEGYLNKRINVSFLFGDRDGG